MKQGVRALIAAMAAAMVGAGLAGCSVAVGRQDAQLEQARLQETRQRIELDKLRIAATRALIARLESETQAQQARAKAEAAAAAHRKHLRAAAVDFLRDRAEQKGPRAREYSELADWVEAGGDPQLALRAVVPGGLRR